MDDRPTPHSGTGSLLAFMRQHGTVSALAFGCAAALIVVLIVESACRVAERVVDSRKCEEAYDPEDFVRYDAGLGAAPQKSVRATATRKCPDGKVIFKAHYTIDEQGRRVTPVDESADRDLFMLFFGCSFMFGEGLNDNETLPYFLARDAPCYTPYNYGFVGYGPQQMLAVLEDGRLAAQVKERRGVAIYGYMGEPGVGHIDRAIGSMRIHGWAKHFPHYQLDAAGLLRRDGDFASGRRARSLIYSALRRSATVRVFGINHPLRITDDHIRLTAKIIRKSAEAFKREFKSEAFYAVSFPGASQVENRELMSLLRNTGIRCLDYSALTEFSQKGYRIDGDEHPSAQWNERLAGKIAHDLRMEGTNCTSVALPAKE